MTSQNIQASTVLGADLGHRCPWRRFFARGLDYALYQLLWRLVLGLGLRVNFARRSAGDKLIDTAVTLLLMLLLEPVLLHCFSTTPGKWLFGLRLGHADGRPLDLMESYQRTLSVLVMGEGCNVPLVNLATNGLSYYRCKHSIPQPWTLENETWFDCSQSMTGDWWDTRDSMRRTAGFVGAYVLCVAASMGILLAASVPRYHGPLTPAQFASNYNQIMRFNSAPDSPAMQLGQDGTWHQTDPDQWVIDILGQPSCDIQMEMEGDAVTGLSFSQDQGGQGEFGYVPTHQMTTALRAMLGRGLPLTGNTAYGRVLEELSQAVPGTRTWRIGGFTVTCTLEYQGYRPVGSGFGPGTTLFPMEGEEQRLHFDFSIRPA